MNFLDPKSIFSRSVRYIPQMEVTECGAASLSMILAYYGYYTTLPELRQNCSISRDGANALAIIRAARSYGLEAKGVKLGMEDIPDLPLPAILHWDFAHFVVLEQFTSSRAVIVDPACGRRSLTLDDLSRHFTGIALVFSPSTVFQRKRSTRPSLTKYREIIKENIPSLSQILLASLALQIVGLVFPIANQILLDRIIGPKQSVWIWGLGFGLGSAVIAKGFLTLVRSYVIQGLQNVLDFSLMGRFLDHMLTLPLGFFLARQPGDLVQRVQSNSEVRNILGSKSISALLDGLLILSYAILMLAYNLKLGSVVLMFGAIRLMLLIGLKNRNQQIMASELAAAGWEGGALVEALTGLETTKALGTEDRLIQRWANRMVQRVNASLERRRLAIGAGQIMALLQGGTTAAVFLVGGNEVLAERMTTGVFTSFLVLQNLFMVPLGTLLESVTQLQYIGNHLRRLDDVLETESEPSGTTEPERLLGAIELKKVGFNYSHGSPSIIQNISLSIKPGEKIALVGPSGAGKSTLARLLLGMHLPTTGAILYDGRSLQDMNLQLVRNQMGVVLQETFLFDDTVRANLCLNEEDIPLDRLVWASRMACFDRVIEHLPAGLESRVGENGNLLSGGERQRLSIARALSHNPRILLLDEATSSLDIETEATIHSNLAGMGLTQIIIAHRLDTIRDADRILVILDGQIIQCGTFALLEAEKEGYFSKLLHSKSSMDGQQVTHA